MADDTGDGGLRTAVITALQQAAQGQWAPAVEALRPFADQDDPIAVAMVAMYLGQGGQAGQGIPYAERAVKGRVAPGAIAANYIQWTNNDPALRTRTPEFFKAAIDAGWTVEPISQAQQLMQQGNPDGAFEVLRVGSSRTLAQVERAWEQLSQDVANSQRRIDTDLAQVSELRAAITAQMNRDAAAIVAERDRIQELVSETTSLVQSVAADNLASEYANRAKSAAARATNWTYATLIVSVAAIGVAAAFVLVGLANHHDATTVLARAAISVPLLALAAYLNKQSSDERRDARNWTHIELQIRTAQPYLGNLSEELRDEVQAALALRFFPGQSQDPHGANAAMNEQEDTLGLIREIVSQVRKPVA